MIKYDYHVFKEINKENTKFTAFLEFDTLGRSDIDVKLDGLESKENFGSIQALAKSVAEQHNKYKNLLEKPGFYNDQKGKYESKTRVYKGPLTESEFMNFCNKFDQLTKDDSK
ncbi:MAG: hypothetical protein JSV92_03690 [archaeon]|nr:MAG: hypothetical protein JSV92_03690 [archaeon]